LKSDVSRRLASRVGSSIFWRVAITVLLSALTLEYAQASTVAGVNFGSATDFGILALGGSNSSGFGSADTQLSMNGPGSGVFGTAANENIGLAGTSSASGWGGTVTVDGTLYYTSQTSGVNTSGQTIVGGIVQNDALLATAAADAVQGLMSANSLFAGGCTPGIGGVACDGSLSSSVTITPGNPNGQNILILSSMNLSNNAVITLGGGANTTWVIEDLGDLTTSHSSIIAQNVNPESVLVVVKGNEHTTGGLNMESVLDGLYVVPTGTAQNSPGEIDGELIAGGSQITFVSGGSVVAQVSSVPEPALLIPTALALIGLIVRRRLVRI